MISRIPASIGLVLLCTLCICSSPDKAPADAAGFHGLDEKNPILVDASAGEVRILAELQPDAFSGGFLKSTPHYHAVVWKGGGAAGEALLAAYVNDATFHDALVSIGAVPGNNLTMDAWNQRWNPDSRSPDTGVEGTPLDVLVRWEGLKDPLPLADMLTDSAGRGIDMRFGGNKSLIHEWHSGCIACLYSCPGGKVSNRSYTIRDYVLGTTRFSVNRAVVPEGKRKAEVIFRRK
jgi:hypothetical protein